MKSTAHPRVIERGILTSAYKQEIRQNVRDMRSNTVSHIKSSLYSSHNKFRSQTGAILKVSIFTLVLAIILLQSKKLLFQFQQSLLVTEILKLRKKFEYNSEHQMHLQLLQQHLLFQVEIKKNHSHFLQILLGQFYQRKRKYLGKCKVIKYICMQNYNLFLPKLIC